MLLTNPCACSSADELVRRHASVFAEWLGSEGGFPAETLAKASAGLAEEVASAWQTAVAEEWLVARNCGFADEPIPVFLRVAQPFPSGPALPDLVSLRAAAAIIPLDRQPHGASARVWVVEDLENKLADFPGAALEGSNDHFPAAGRYRLFISGCDPAKVDGPSWQLGALLARETLEKSHPTALRKLASKWIITGQVSVQKAGDPWSVESVGLGAKSKLLQGKRDGGRNWLLPAANERPAEGDFAELASRAAGRLHFARTVADAWGHLTGEGTHLAPDQLWPADCEEIHGFVSDAQGPFLALILQTMPKTLVLWITPTMKDQAAELKEALRRVCCQLDLKMPEVLEVETPEARSDPSGHGEVHLLNATQRALASHSSLGTVQGPLILFNNTGGNFLHRAAALQRASLNPRIWLAYRDLNNAKTLTFTLLRQQLGRTIEGRLRMNGDRLPVQWIKLLDHPRLRPRPKSAPKPSSEEMIKPTQEDQISALIAAAIPEKQPAGASHTT